MRKAFIALGVIFVALLVAFATFNQQPKYAGVSMPRADYRHLEQSRRSIKTFISALDDFDYQDAKTMAVVEKSGNQIITIVQIAKKGHYNIDSSVASRFHDKFDTIITMSVNAMNKSSAQRADIVTQMKVDLNIEAAIYRIGAKNEE